MPIIPPHILLVEDSATHAQLIRDALIAWSAGARLTIAGTLQEARGFLSRSTPDLALVDLHLPDGRGTELLPADREQALFPVVLLTGSGDEKTAVEAMKAGALDYLVKSGEILNNLPYIAERSLREWGHIVRRRRAEAALRRSERKYHGLFEHMTEAVAIKRLLFDPRGRPVDWLVTDVNPAYEKFFGIPCEQAVGRRASELYRGVVDIRPHLAVHARVAATGVPEQFEIAFPPTGRYLLVSVFSLGDGEYATVTRDLTRRRRAEAERERLLAELEATINSIADGVVIYSPDATILHMNPTALRTLGHPESEGHETLAERVVRLGVETEEGRPMALEETPGWRALQGETVNGCVMVLHPAGQETVWVAASAAPIRAGDGRLLGAVATFTDITALHELQHQRELLLHSISHDLRMPLTVIQGYAQLQQEALSRAGADEDSHFIGGEIMKGVRRMNRMIEDLVDSARLDGGRPVPEQIPLDLAAFARELVDRFPGVLAADRIAMEVSPDVAPVLADPGHLERILLNLLTNAQKYSPAEFTIRLLARRKGQGVEVAVVDQGQGIAREDQAHIFERFYRPRGGRRADSVGLGLYITRTLVEAYGGRIRVDSTPGLGSTFSFTLPLA